MGVFKKTKYKEKWKNLRKNVEDSMKYYDCKKYLEQRMFYDSSPHQEYINCLKIVEDNKLDEPAYNSILEYMDELEMDITFLDKFLDGKWKIRWNKIKLFVDTLEDEWFRHLDTPFEIYELEKAEILDEWYKSLNMPGIGTRIICLLKGHCFDNDYVISYGTQSYSYCRRCKRSINRIGNYFERNKKDKCY